MSVWRRRLTDDAKFFGALACLAVLVGLWIYWKGGLIGLAVYGFVLVAAFVAAWA